MAFEPPYAQDYPTSMQLVNAGLGSTSDPYKADVRINYGSGMSLSIDYGDGRKVDFKPIGKLKFLFFFIC